MSERACIHCGSTAAELRPYGPKGAWLCFACMKASPDRERDAVAAYQQQLAAASAASTNARVFIGTKAGPYPAPPESKP